MARETLITPEGLEKLKDELEYLETDKRREVADRIKQAREFGDIAENSEYDDAKNEQAMLEQRIASLQDRLRRAAVIDKKQIDTETVGVGASSTSRTRSPASRRSSRSSGRPRRPDRAEALERVADRQGADREQEERGRDGGDAARPQEEAQDHQDRNRVAATRPLSFGAQAEGRSDL